MEVLKETHGGECDGGEHRKLNKAERSCVCLNSTITTLRYLHRHCARLLLLLLLLCITVPATFCVPNNYIIFLKPLISIIGYLKLV